LPLDQAVARLQTLANAGDTAAQRRLTWRLNACTPRQLRAAAASDETDRELLETDKQNTSLDKDLRAVRILNVQGRIDDNAAAREACAKLPPDLVAHWLDPLDRAAQAGDTEAMREYASLAIADYDSVQSIVADIDTALARRDKARAYLLQALQLGDPGSLSELAGAYFVSNTTPSLFDADPFQAYAYAYAATLTGTSLNRASLDWIMSQSAQSLNAGQLIDAQNQGQRIYEQCCSNH
jgi:hypothetical protein